MSNNPVKINPQLLEVNYSVLHEVISQSWVPADGYNKSIKTLLIRKLLDAMIEQGFVYFTRSQDISADCYHYRARIFVAPKGEVQNFVDNK